MGECWVLITVDYEVGGGMGIPNVKCEQPLNKSVKSASKFLLLACTSPDQVINAELT